MALLPDRMITVNIANVVNFYDNDKEESSHAGSIKILAGEDLGFGLMCHYFHRTNKAARVFEEKCTVYPEGGKGTRRLDGWLRVEDNVGAIAPIFYQVEIKSWSIHGFSENKVKKMPISYSPTELSEEMEKCWKRYYGGTEFNAEQLKKVHFTSKRDNLPDGALVEAIACLWAPMHPQGRMDEPFFPVSKAGNGRIALSVFSMSAYLRLLHAEGEKTAVINMPRAARRFDHLSSLFNFSDAQ